LARDSRISYFLIFYAALVLASITIIGNGYNIRAKNPEIRPGLILVVDTAGGGDHSTIQEAIDVSENGTIINISPGTYQEHLVIMNRTIALVGQSENTVIIGGGTGSTLEIFCDNVTLFSLTIRNGGDVVNGDGVVIYGSSNITITDCIFEQTSNGISLLPLEGNLSGNCRITDNVFRDNDGDGIYVEAGTANLIHGNTCSKNENIGIRMEGGEDNIIRSNKLNGNDGGIMLVRCNDTLISENDITDTNEAVYVEDSSGCTISGNTCRDNWAGLYLISAHNNSMVGNICSRGGYNGIYLYLSHDNEIVNNTCSSNDLGGIYLSAGRNNVIGGNTCFYNRYHGIFLDDASTGNTVTDNSIRAERKDGSDLSYIRDIIVPAILVILIVSAVVVRLRARKNEKRNGKRIEEGNEVGNGKRNEEGDERRNEERIIKTNEKEK